MELSERKKRILSAIVEEYIITGEPVGSKFLAKETGINLSPATIRNEMAELTDMGFISQPHTSAGRVPTILGYRMYVDHLMGEYELSDSERAAYDELFNLQVGDIESTLEKACDILADITGCASVSTAPNDKAATIKRIEIFPSGLRSILMVILTSSGIIKSRICKTLENLTPDMMNFFYQLVNDRFCGLKLEDMTEEFLNKVKHELYEYTFALSPVVDAIAEELRSISNEVFIGGASNLLAYRDIDGDKLIKMMKLLEHRDELMRIIGDMESGVKVKIGCENGMPFMDNSAIIAAPYALNGRVCGTVGIIGPARINYPKMVSSIEYFSNMLSKFIEDSFGD